MQLKLSLPVSTDIATVLKIVYAFAPTYEFEYNSTTNALETIIDASHDLTPDQYAIVGSEQYNLTIVLPTPAPVPVPAGS